MRKFLARFRQAPVFSTVYVLGAALSVASVMLVAIFLHVKTSNIYPEYSRDKMLHLDMLNYKYVVNDSIEPIGYNTNEDFQIEANGSMSPQFARMLRDTLQHTCDVGICATNSKSISVYANNKRNDNITLREADYSLFNVIDYQFTEGKPFTKEDVESNASKAVISDRLARKLFGTDKEIIGREIIVSTRKLNYFGEVNDQDTPMRVCGVFKEGSRLLPQSFAEIIIPSLPEISNTEFFNEVTVFYPNGANKLIIIPKDGVSPEQVKETIDALLNKFASSLPLPIKTRYLREEWTDEEGHHIRYSSGSGISGTADIEPGKYAISSGTYPRGNLQMMLGNPADIDEKFNFVGFTKLYGVIILILLLVPALNLSSLISGNMDSKMSEMGIRKAFGAKNSTLLRQVLNENLWLTGCGAILGVILSWIGVALWKDWLFTVGGAAGNGSGVEDMSHFWDQRQFAGSLSTTDVMLDPAMLFAPQVFIAAVVICFTLNILSSLIPVWWALRRPAIDAIKSKS